MARNLLARYRARGWYFTASDEAAQAWAEFTEPGGTPLTRCRALSVAADCERTMSANAFGFRRADKQDEDGFTLGQSHSMAALLLELVADTELASLRPDADNVPWRWRSNLADDPTVAAVLAGLSIQVEPALRAALTVSLCDVVVDRVGAQAAESLAWVACGYYVLSGMSLAEAQWRTGPHGPTGTGGER
jgi:hypothetical protein